MKKVLKFIGGLIFIILVLPVFLTSKFSMSRAIEIDAPIATVFESLTNLSEYEKWNPFPEGDPTNTTSISGTGVGSFLVWKGEKTGEGKMTITTIVPQQKIGVKMDFYRPMSGEGVVHWITNAKSEAKTEMIWTFDQELTYFTRYFGLFMEPMMGKHFEKGLANFKNRMEASK